MREQTAILGTVADLRKVVDDAVPLLMQAVDWNASRGAAAERVTLIEDYLEDLATQVAVTVTAIGDAGCEQPDPRTFERLKDIILVAISDEYAEPWRDVQTKAAEARSPYGRGEIDADRAREDMIERRMMEHA